MKKKVTEEQIADFIKRAESGESEKDIAQSYGYSYQVVHYWCKKGRSESEPTKATRCSECYYNGHYGGNYRACEYILFTGNQRPCSAEECTVFKPKEKKKPTIGVYSGGKHPFPKEKYKKLLYSQEIYKIDN